VLTGDYVCTQEVTMLESPRLPSSLGLEVAKYRRSIDGSVRLRSSWNQGRSPWPQARAWQTRLLLLATFLHSVRLGGRCSRVTALGAWSFGQLSFVETIRY
jgi:hypothetical protein